MTLDKKDERGLRFTSSVERLQLLGNVHSRLASSRLAQVPARDSSHDAWDFRQDASEFESGGKVNFEKGGVPGNPARSELPIPAIPHVSYARPRIVTADPLWSLSKDAPRHCLASSDAVTPFNLIVTSRFIPPIHHLLHLRCPGSFRTKSTALYTPPAQG